MVSEIASFINHIDIAVLKAVNSLATKSYTFDYLFTEFLMLPSTRALPMVVLIAYYWFAEPDRNAHRMVIGRGAVGAFLALVITRVVQNVSPHRARPLHDPTVGFVVPREGSIDTLREWSSFPSDTAAFGFALAMIVFFCNRRLGALALVWAGLVCGFTRIYVGFHYPFDVLVGSLVGVASVWACVRWPVYEPLARRLAEPVQRYPAIYGTMLFLIAYEFATAFEDIRRFAVMVHAITS